MKQRKKKKTLKLESLIPVLDQHRPVKEGYQSIFLWHIVFSKKLWL